MARLSKKKKKNLMVGAAVVGGLGLLFMWNKARQQRLVVAAEAAKPSGKVGGGVMPIIIDHLANKYLPNIKMGLPPEQFALATPPSNERVWV